MASTNLRLVALGLLLGCPSDDSPSDSATEGSSAAQTGSDDDDDQTSNGTPPPTSTTATVPTGTASVGPTATDPGSESGPGAGCTGTADCASGQYCDFPDDSCGVSGMNGICTDVVAGCTDDDRPVCGCDDTLHGNVCDASAQGQDVAFLGECDVPNGAFRCGFSFCISGDEYCQEQAGAMPTGECIELPPVCVPPDCSCITTCCGCDNATCCSEFCSNDDGDLTYVCP